MANELPELRSLDAIRGLMKEHQVHTLVFKRLSPNDNSKNQIYLGGGYSSLQLLPFGKINADKSRKDSKRDRLKAELAFYWMDDEGALFEAPNAQLILYPKYPEVRMSGFLNGAQTCPARYLRSREEGRILLLGVTDDRRIIGHVVGQGNPVCKELAKFDGAGVLGIVSQRNVEGDTRGQLLEALRGIADQGWVNSFRLNSKGIRIPYRALNGGGYTLEGLLGVVPNGFNEPDFLGWEIKQHKVSQLDKPLSGGPITLMTPEPTGGVYRSEGVLEFVKRFGYPDQLGRADRMNFGGVHRVGEQHARTGLTLSLVGYDADTGIISDIEGGIALLSSDGTKAAIWHYGALLEKWNKKHAQAAYIPSNSRKNGAVQYRYGYTVALGTGTDFGRFLGALSAKSIYYDPGIKVEAVSSETPKQKRRSQFRVKPKDIPQLYENMAIVDLKV